MSQREATMEHPNVRLRRELEEKNRKLEENERWTEFVEAVATLMAILNIVLILHM